MSVLNFPHSWKAISYSWSFKVMTLTRLSCSPFRTLLTTSPFSAQNVLIGYSINCILKANLQSDLRLNLLEMLANNCGVCLSRKEWNAGHLLPHGNFLLVIACIIKILVQQRAAKVTRQIYGIKFCRYGDRDTERLKFEVVNFPEEKLLY